MSLNDIIGRAVELCQRAGSVDVHRVVNTALPFVMDDDETRDMLVRDALGRRVKDSLTKLSRAAGDEVKQASFFGDHLRRRYALDLEGRVIKETEFLSRFEFERIISIREKQIVADMAHLEVLKRARDALAPIWDRNPTYTYGEAEAAFLAAERAA